MSEMFCILCMYDNVINVKYVNVTFVRANNYGN